MTTTLTRTIETSATSVDGVNFTEGDSVATVVTFDEILDDSVILIGDKSFTLETLKKLVSDAEYVLLQSKD
tara:strand:- start:606 stop:818 length:213 start_codon:yes stop_codon:yes gene_type:complete